MAGTTRLYLDVMRETFDKVNVILDQAFGDALRARIGGRAGDARAPWDSASPRPSRF